MQQETQQPQESVPQLLEAMTTQTDGWTDFQAKACVLEAGAKINEIKVNLGLSDTDTLLIAITNGIKASLIIPNADKSIFNPEEHWSESLKTVKAPKEGGLLGLGTRRANVQFPERYVGQAAVAEQFMYIASRLSEIQNSKMKPSLIESELQTNFTWLRRQNKLIILPKEESEWKGQAITIDINESNPYHTKLNFIDRNSANFK